MIFSLRVCSRSHWDARETKSAVWSLPPCEFRAWINVGDEEEEPVAEVVHTSRLRVERIKGPLRHAYLEGFSEPIRFGVHGGIKAFYGIEPEEDVPATLDHMVGAVGG